MLPCSLGRDQAPTKRVLHRRKLDRGVAQMILVTGANGSNGSEIVKRLSGMGAAVRAMVRTPSDQAKGILPGVEIATADFDQPGSVRRALEGVDRVFLVTNSSERVEKQQLQF